MRYDVLYNVFMRVYFSGIGGVGIGPLCEIARDAGYDVAGSDRQASQMTQQLEESGINLSLDQSGDFLRAEHTKQPFDWFIYTAALPKDHPELLLARQLNLKIAKRDELLAYIIQEKRLKLIAVTGTHGKTSTTSLLVWAAQQLKLPVSYSIGAPISFGPSGAFDSTSKYFIYECDEFDRNFLHFQPAISLITTIDYDHPDTYPTEANYRQAFADFLRQSQQAILWQQDFTKLGFTDQPDNLQLVDKIRQSAEIDQIPLVGRHNRENAFLVLAALRQLLPNSKQFPNDQLLQALENFPGAGRRFEKLADNLYSDYAHHPAEIAATLSMAKEIAKRVILIYQPHQNIRQHEIAERYTDGVFEQADEIYWLPTYLSREDPNLEILTPSQLTSRLSTKKLLHLADFDNELWQKIQIHLQNKDLVLCIGAGSIDGWIRQQLTNRAS